MSILSNKWVLLVLVILAALFLWPRISAKLGK